MVLHRLRNSTIAKMRQQGKNRVHRRKIPACRFGAAEIAGWATFAFIVAQPMGDPAQFRRQDPLIGAKLKR
jgi:hypothetical protein